MTIMKTNLTEIANYIYLDNSGQISRKNINYIINECFSYIAQALIDDKAVMVTNFGILRRTKHKLYPSVSFAAANRLKKTIREEMENN